ncbi:division plane positioning ATPase MipZ [Ferruginivarius sediminum]|nr:division plane positioning ATPase MipZ [Ferruginivarius sediminum]
MKVISLASRQCGSGKTVLAIHLAHAAAQLGSHRIALIDTDQHGSLDYWRRKGGSAGFTADSSVEVFRTAPEKLPEMLHDLSCQGFHIALIDTVWRPRSATEAAVELSDLVVVPAAPTEDELIAATATATTVRAASRQILFVLNRDMGEAEVTAQAHDRLARLGPIASVTIPYVRTLPRSVVAGRTVIDDDPHSDVSRNLLWLWRDVVNVLEAQRRPVHRPPTDAEIARGPVVVKAPPKDEDPEAQPAEAADAAPAAAESPAPSPGGYGGRVVVVGNQKGGSGKSTMAMHFAIGFLYQGLRVATVDLDAGQRTLTHYLENRRAHARATGAELALPGGHILGGDTHTDLSFGDLMSRLRDTHDIVIVDTPSGLTKLSRKAHSELDILVTPINDSFLDLDVLGGIDAETLDHREDGAYGRIARHAVTRGVTRDGKTPSWIVCRNRLSNLDAHNKRNVCDALERLAQRLGFTVAPGFSERVIYRGLFLRGLTLLDLRRASVDTPMSMSHVAARQELRALLELVGGRLWPGWQPDLDRTTGGAGARGQASMG